MVRKNYWVVKHVYTGRSKNIHEAAIMRNKYIIEHYLPNKINKIMGD